MREKVKDIMNYISEKQTIYYVDNTNFSDERKQSLQTFCSLKKWTLQPFVAYK